MNIVKYRRDFADYNSALYLSQYRHRAGLDPDLHMRDIYDRYGELFTLDAIDRLKQAENDTPASLKTEHGALHALSSAACIGHLAMEAREITDECARQEAAMHVEWNGRPITVHSLPKAIASEVNPATRRNLAELWAKAIGSLNELRASRMKSFYTSSKALGFSSYQGLFSAICRIDYTQLLTSTEAFLHRTESTYALALARASTRYLPDVAPDELRHADFLYFQRMSWLDGPFPRRELMSTYYNAMGALGINAEKQPNIHFDSEERASKNPRAACFPINAPDDVRLLIAPIGGVYDYTTLFHEAGHAQHFAWTSRHLATTYPEFVNAPDYATTEGYAFLLQNLFLDSFWLIDNCALDKDGADAVVRDLSLIQLLVVRRYCAKLKFEIDLHGSSDVRSSQHGVKYVLAQEQATGFRRSPELYLWDVDDGFYAAEYLRAWAFEASLREYLRTRYGRRWWASHRAGDELIDLWNAGSQYSVEELSRLTGFGDINFDLLADNLIAGVNQD